MTPLADTAERPDELDAVLATFAGISESLRRSYDDLARRAERVEEDLCRANDELASKVAELDATRAHLEAVLQALPTGVIVRDASGRIVRANDAALAILGAETSEVLGRRAPALLEGRPSPEGGASEELACPSGRRLVLARRRSPMSRGERGAGSVEILDDRTELVELAERLHRADKLAALGTMAGGIAHEIRNPMNAIKGFARLLEVDLPEASRERRRAATISAAVDEIERIIASMLTLASPERLAHEAVEPAELVAAAVEAALGVLPSGADRARWRIETAARAPAFRADRIKLRQALRNLIANAIEAQPGGGRVRVELRAEGGEIALEVADAGPGIPAALRAKVTDPFFTTRAEGTGLGLALVQRIAELHGGRLDIDPAPAPDGWGGARITIRIPFQPDR